MDIYRLVYIWQRKFWKAGGEQYGESQYYNTYAQATFSKPFSERGSSSKVSTNWISSWIFVESLVSKIECILQHSEEQNPHLDVNILWNEGHTESWVGNVYESENKCSRGMTMGRHFYTLRLLVNKQSQDEAGNLLTLGLNCELLESGLARTAER
jgi:hypothetical protein